jgi:predicted RNA-binding Zn ribbon-like protein
MGISARRDARESLGSQMSDEPSLDETRETREVEGAERVFNFSGGRLCLDFANTLGGEIDARREDLETYDDLVTWSRQAGVLDGQDAAGLRRAARERPPAAEAALADARNLRARIARVVSAHARGEAVDGGDLAALGDALLPLLSRSRLVAADGGFAWAWAGPGDALERPLWAVARSVVDLLTSPDLATVRECSSPSCSWLFVDTTRNHSRRWCDMSACGNREKARRHYKRSKSG